MKKVRLFVKGDMTVIDLGEDTFKNFHSYDCDSVIANVVEIKKKVLTFFDGEVNESYEIFTDFINPYREKYSKFSLTKENFEKVQWVE